VIGDRRGVAGIVNRRDNDGFLRGPSFIGSTAAGAVIAVALAGVVDRLDNNGLAPWPFLHRQHGRGRGDRRGPCRDRGRARQRRLGVVIGAALPGSWTRSTTTAWSGDRCGVAGIVDALDSDGLER
jgi:hypothetical protein